MAPPIDLRSDTVTKPSPEMRRAMAHAEVGDDWYGDDPTVNHLQDRAAEITGKDAALYVATGTMANQIALHVFVRSGHVVVCEAAAHVASTEVSTSAVLSGIAFAGIDPPDHRLTPDLVERAIRPDPYDVEVIDLVEVENTHQVGGGLVFPVEDLRGIRKAAEQRGLPVYMDGARLFNASAASGVPVNEYGAEVDALMFALSKGLGGPIGSVLCGSREFIAEARRVKVLIGGAWRQAGIMAAAGLVALDTGPGRLVEDHVNARRLADGISEITPAVTDMAGVETNIVFLDTAAAGIDPWDANAAFGEEGVLTTVVAGKVRLVTHLDVGPVEIEGAIAAWERIVERLGATASRTGGGG